MKIAYVSLHWPRTTSSSVGKKILRQKKQWQSMGHTVLFFSHLHTISEPQQLLQGKRFFYPNNHGLLQREIGRIKAAGQLLKSLREYEPDIIYLRWGMYTIPMRQIFSIAPVIVEVNTNDKKEHRHLGFVLNMYNRLTRSIFLRLADGAIFTSKELRNDPAFTTFVTHSLVVSNGIELDDIPYYKAPANTPPQLIFLGTPGMAWHGLEKLREFALENSDITIDIAGSDDTAISGSIPSNFKMHGYLRGEAFESLLANADAAIGSISLHRNDMNEASPFKIRDCVARGIPVILPYIDTDLSNLDYEEVLQIPNTPDNLKSHTQAIRDFIFKMQGRRIQRNRITKHIGIKEKERARVDFFHKILENNTH